MRTLRPEQGLLSVYGLTAPLGRARRLSPKQIDAIIGAADRLTLEGNPHSPQLRERLLKACGLSAAHDGGSE